MLCPLSWVLSAMRSRFVLIPLTWMEKRGKTGRKTLGLYRLRSILLFLLSSFRLDSPNPSWDWSPLLTSVLSKPNRRKDFWYLFFLLLDSFFFCSFHVNFKRTEDEFFFFGPYCHLYVSARQKASACAKQMLWWNRTCVKAMNHTAFRRYDDQHTRKLSPSCVHWLGTNLAVWWKKRNIILVITGFRVRVYNVFM